MSKFRETLAEAQRILDERAATYGGVEDCFLRIAAIATQILGKPVTPHDVCMIQVAVKLGRLAENPAHHDSYVDLINYASFADQFAVAAARAALAKAGQ